MNVIKKQREGIYTDMMQAAKTVYATLLNGTQEEIERAVKFSMIAIDAEKHLLDVQQARRKYGFDELEQKYVRGIKTE